MRSPVLPPMRMNAAETSASRAIAPCTPLAVVSRSCDDRRDRHVHERRVEDEHEHRHGEEDGEAAVELRGLGFAFSHALTEPHAGAARSHRDANHPGEILSRRSSRPSESRRGSSVSAAASERAPRAPHHDLGRTPHARAVAQGDDRRRSRRPRRRGRPGGARARCACAPRGRARAGAARARGPRARGCGRSRAGPMPSADMRATSRSCSTWRSE